MHNRHLKQDRKDVDPNILMVRCTYNALVLRPHFSGMSYKIDIKHDSAVIVLHQRHALPMDDSQAATWFHASQRCLEACDDMAHGLEDMADHNLLHFTPYLIFCIFVAARFYVGM